MQQDKVASTPLSRLSEQNLAEIVAAIRSVLEPQAIILFGSQARGTATADSDIDLLVVRKDDFRPGESRRAEIGRLYDAVTDVCAIPKDILLFTDAEYRDWKETTNHPLAQARRGGRILYGEL
jgi:predicted nucleotidyltransferase